jgi:hypothetical protein
MQVTRQSRPTIFHDDSGMYGPVYRDALADDRLEPGQTLPVP